MTGQPTTPGGTSLSRMSFLSRTASWRERAKASALDVGRQRALDSRTKVQVLRPEKPLSELIVQSTIKDTLYFTFFGFDRYRHWDDFENLKEGVGVYLPGKLGMADLALFCIAAMCVLLSMFGLAPRGLSVIAVLSVPHYISDACTLELITLKLVISTFEWKLLAAHNVLFCLGLSDLFRDFRVVGVWLGFFPGFLLVSCMDAVTFTAVKTRTTMTLFLVVVIVPLLLAVFIGIARGLVPICPREIVCSRSRKTCVVLDLAGDESCGGTAIDPLLTAGSGAGGYTDTLAAQFGAEPGALPAGDIYTLLSNLGLTTTALTTLIMFQLKYSFYWCKHRTRTMLLTVYVVDGVCCVYTCRRLIDLFLIAGTWNGRWRRALRLSHCAVGRDARACGLKAARTAVLEKAKPEECVSLLGAPRCGCRSSPENPTMLMETIGTCGRLGFRR